MKSSAMKGLVQQFYTGWMPTVVPKQHQRGVVEGTIPK